MLSLRRAGRLLDLNRAILGSVRAAGLPESLAYELQEARRSSSSSAASSPIHIEDETYCRQRQQLVLGNRIPYVAPDAWIASNAVIIGDVDLFDRVSIWYGCVLRGDLSSVRVGAFSNIQDRTVIHAARTSPTGLSSASIVGRYVTVGKACMLRSATIQDEVLIGDRSVLMEGSFVETQSVLAPGSVLPPGRLVATGELWAGNPAKLVRKLSKDEKAGIANVAKAYFQLVSMHESQFLPNSFAYIQAEKLKQSVGAVTASSDANSAPATG